jgi:hypothetical protein
MKLRILLFALIAFPAISQVTYQSSKYKPVWYSSTYEKTHATYATFDTSSIKAYFTPLGKPEFKMIGPTANTLFYIDSTGSFGAYAGSATLPWVLKTAFDDSLNNPHTITGAWKFSGAVGSVPAGQVSIGKNATNGYIKLTASDNDTLIITSGATWSQIKSKNALRFYHGANYFTFSGGAIGSTDGGLTLGNDASRILDTFIKDGLYVGGIGSNPTFVFGNHSDITEQADSCLSFSMVSGQPVFSFFASDEDSYTQSINTSDQAVFSGASGGYSFDADLTYNFIHFVGSADSVAVTPVVTQYIYTKLLPGIVAHETDGVTFAADSLTVLTAGDYICHISISLSGTNANDYWRIKVFKNNAALPNTGAGSVGRFVFRTTANNQTDTREYVWYLKDLAVNDVLSWRITNLSATRNPTVTDMKLYFHKIPE